MTLESAGITRRKLVRAGAALFAYGSATRLLAHTGLDDAQPLPKSGETLPTQSPSNAIRALLVGGGSAHDFETWFHVADSATLKSHGVFTAYTSNVDEAIAQLANADVLVFSANHASFGTQEFQKALNSFADAGHGMVICHAGVWFNWKDAPEYNRRFVGGGAHSHGRGEFTVFNRQPNHPVMAGVPAEFKIVDEQYRVALDAGALVEVLAETGPEPASGNPFPSVWSVNDEKARFVNVALGHAAEAHGNPAYQAILVNAVRWVSAGRH